MRPSGRDFPLQPHFRVNRIANWSPSTGTTVTSEGLPITSVGTVSTPTLAATSLAASMRRWRLTSAAVADSVADQRSAGWACWRGNAAGLGGWTFVTRISLTTLQATGMGFFGFCGSMAALAATLTLAAAVNCTSIGFQRGTHANWQLVRNDGSGAPTLTDMGASFAIATGGALTLFIAAPPNGSSVRIRVVDEVSGAIVESFFKSLKAELVWRRDWQTHREVEIALFEYINGFQTRAENTRPSAGNHPWPSNRAPLNMST